MEEEITFLNIFAPEGRALEKGDEEAYYAKCYYVYESTNKKKNRLFSEHNWHVRQVY